jgi:hypothetical protein
MSRTSGFLPWSGSSKPLAIIDPMTNDSFGVDLVHFTFSNKRIRQCQPSHHRLIYSFFQSYQELHTDTFFRLSRLMAFLRSTTTRRGNRVLPTRLLVVPLTFVKRVCLEIKSNHLLSSGMTADTAVSLTRKDSCATSYNSHTVIECKLVKSLSLQLVATY